MICVRVAGRPECLKCLTCLHTTTYGVLCAQGCFYHLSGRVPMGTQRAIRVSTFLTTPATSWARRQRVHCAGHIWPSSLGVTARRCWRVRACTDCGETRQLKKNTPTFHFVVIMTVAGKIFRLTSLVLNTPWMDVCTIGTSVTILDATRWHDFRTWLSITHLAAWEKSRAFTHTRSLVRLQRKRKTSWPTWSRVTMPR